jgi:hypothetical protein
LRPRPRRCLGVRARAARGRAPLGRSFPMTARMPWAPCTSCRRTVAQGPAVRPVSSSREAPRGTPSILRSLGGSRVAYKGPVPWPRRAGTPNPSPEPPAVPLGAAAANSGPASRTAPRRHSHPLARLLVLAVLLTHSTGPPPHRNTHRRGHHPSAPLTAAAGRLSARFHFPNRS